MKKQSLLICIATVVLIAAAAGVISYRKSHQRLGIPGVTVLPVPVYDPDGKIAGTNSVALPDTVLNFTSEVRPVEKIVLDWLPKDTTYGQRIYKSADGLQISMGVVLMGADRTSIHKPEYCLKGSGWLIDDAHTVFDQVSLPNGSGTLPIRTMPISRSVKLPSGDISAVHGFYTYWFIADGQITADHNERMRWMARDLLLTGVLQRWAYISCLVVAPSGQEDATYRRLKEFIAEGAPQFQRLPGASTRVASKKPR